MKTTSSAFLILFLLLAITGCDQQQAVGPDTEEEILPPLTNKSSSSKKAVASNVDPFADIVIEDGVIDLGQGFTDPAGILGNLQVIDPTKTPPVTGLGVGGFAVVDMGEGEEIKNKQGADFLVIEADGSVLAAGFGFPEPLSVSVSASPTGPFVTLSTTNGSGFFDLQGSGVNTARYVRIQDAGGIPPSGADIQGVVAINHNGADFRLTPSTLKRSTGPSRITGHLQTPRDFDVATASIVLVTTLDESAPPPPPYVSSLDIPGTLQGNGRVIKFDKAAVLDEAPNGDTIIVAVKLTSTSGEVLYLFDLVDVRP